MNVLVSINTINVRTTSIALWAQRYEKKVIDGIGKMTKFC